MRWVLYPVAILMFVGILAVATIAAVVWPNLPSLEVLTDYRPKIPLRIYTSDNYLLGEYGEERRSFVRIADVPQVLIKAILAAEDERFYEHPGVDLIGILRATGANIVSGGKAQGASTITMQVARNFFLTREKTLSRKFYEILLALNIERNLTKDQILEIYINQIYLGQRAYGFAAAADTYFGKPLKDLSIPEAAMLAGLPKAPSAYNPVVNPKRAAIRQQYVLRRMAELKFIDDAAFKSAIANPVHTVAGARGEKPIHGDHVAEMARQIAVAQFKDDAYRAGIRITTTVTRTDQEAAYSALRRGVMEYDRRHGYRGPEAYIAMAGDNDEQLDDQLGDIPDYGDLLAAVVLQATPREVQVYRHGEIRRISGEGLRFAQPMLSEKAPPNKRIRRGAIVRVREDDKGRWEITQVPDVESAFISIDAKDGAVRALVGGFDFQRNKFNHVTQAYRQPGSSFKPFIYSAALERGYSPLSMVEDAPLSFPAGVTGGQPWEPKNYDNKYEGPMTLRTALAKSKNMVSIRLLQSIGTRYAQDYISRFGIPADRNPPYLTMALGAGSTTPWEMASAYAIFANGGFRIQPYIIKEVIDGNGQVVARTDPPIADESAARVLDPRNAYLMTSMMEDVVRRGTATRALALNRGDLAGKTGTTNDYLDAWFCGFNPEMVGVAWIGFDQPRNMGKGETGGAAALPIWVNYMRIALDGKPEVRRDLPGGLIAVTPEGSPRQELIYQENLPALPPSAPFESQDDSPAMEAPTEPPPNVSPAHPSARAPVVERSIGLSPGVGR
ncbi:MAG: penicillin-binding protein 1A [Zoogloeaceae bacterium]|nr:penicillin-binding protein 1A [Zoogloeaceae bacterium]